jgi:nicotinic acid mononucleotide adenylyltransferase
MQTISVTTNLRRLALLPGAFHPVTTAHMAIARAALAWADAVWFTLPRAFPHKSYDQVTMQDRLDLIRAAIDDERMAAVVSQGGLMIEMVREARRICPAVEQIYVVCGRDAAERIVAWDYDGVEPIEEQLEEYELLVAAREGEYQPPGELAGRIHAMPMTERYDDVSATVLREQIRVGGDWERFTPAAIRERVKELYGPRG